MYKIEATPGLKAQMDYVAKYKVEKTKLGLIVGDAFVRGIRDIGYKHTGTAIAELIDNAYQAGAQHVHVAFGFEGGSSKPSSLAIIDDGHGMVPEMIQLASMWGGTHRENDRKGFGRFGYGLPSSCVSQGRRFTVYSKPRGGELFALTLDIDEIAEGKYTDKDGEILMPQPEKSALPKFVLSYIKSHYPKSQWEHGTVVVIEKLDRLTWKTAGALVDNLAGHFGITYHRLKSQLNIVVNGTTVEPIDPLFLTPGCRYYDIDEDRAEALDPLPIEVKDPETRKIAGSILVRYAKLPATFGAVDKTRKAAGKNQNPRARILKDYNGIIVSRMGRVIDVVHNVPDVTFMNNDRFFKIEVDFSPELDEEFNVSTSKQRVDVSDRIWSILKEGGFPKAIELLRQRIREDLGKMKALRDKATGKEKRPSEEAMEKVSAVVRPQNPEAEARQAEQAKELLRKEAERRARESGKSIEETEKQLSLELGNKLYKLTMDRRPGAPFFRVEQLGGTKILELNTAHRFYIEVYAGASSNSAVRAALEVLLFSIGDCRLSATDDVKAMYDYELVEWSRRLEYALAQLANLIVHDEAEEADADTSEEKKAA